MKGKSPRASQVARALLLSLVSLGGWAAGAGCGGQAETRPARWSYISAAIIQPNCATANCHSELSQRSGVKLDDMRTGYDQLLSRGFVTPMKPESSALIGLLNGAGTRRMPPDFALPDADIDLISAWIAAGAADN